MAPWLVGLLAALAVMLAAIGVFSAFAYAVAQRTTEIGIRMALGARPAQIVAALLGTSARAVALGLGFGLARAAAGSRLIARLLYGLSPYDPVAYLTAAGILALAGLAATYIPAGRATRIDPAAALRQSL